jgi:hypothetical protein
VRLSLGAAASGLQMDKFALYEPAYMIGDQASAPPADYEQQLGDLIVAGLRDDAVAASCLR